MKKTELAKAIERIDDKIRVLQMVRQELVDAQSQNKRRTLQVRRGRAASASADVHE